MRRSTSPGPGIRSGRALELHKPQIPTEKNKQTPEPPGLALVLSERDSRAEVLRRRVDDQRRRPSAQAVMKEDEREAEQ